MDNKFTILFDAQYRTGFSISSLILPYLREGLWELVPHMYGLSTYSNNLLSVLSLDMKGTARSKYSYALYKSDVYTFLRICSLALGDNESIGDFSSNEIKLFMTDLDNWLLDESQVCILVSSTRTA